MGKRNLTEQNVDQVYNSRRGCACPNYTSYQKLPKTKFKIQPEQLQLAFVITW